MEKLKENVEIPDSLRYKTGTSHEPLTFFSEALCSSTTFDLTLGFFSSSAISLFASGFAVFLYNQGRMRLNINTAVTQEDREAFLGEQSAFFPDSDIDLVNLKKIYNTLSKRDRHFFECLSYLVAKKRLEVRITYPRDRNGITHSKCGCFSDGEEKIAFEGSCNFTRYAMLENIESISVFPSWEGEGDRKRIASIEDGFDRIFSGREPDVVSLTAEDFVDFIKDYFPPKEITELLKQEIEFEKGSDVVVTPSVMKSLEKSEKILQKLEDEPRFPFGSSPRAYQKEAFNNWRNNPGHPQKGLFAMATGTGKTITALNILLEIYKKEGSYRAVILVPSKSLADQWEEECRKFNFKHIIRVTEDPDWKEQLKNNKTLLSLGADGLDSSFIVICLYNSFGMSTKFRELTSFSEKDYKRILFIADEAHSLGASSLLRKLPQVKFARRIGLTATPDRYFEPEATAKLLDFFGAKDKLTFSYPMGKAIEDGILCRYFYYPIIVELTPEELQQYKEVTKKIGKLWGSGTRLDEEGMSRNSALNSLLIQRKRIIHKAANKLVAFKKIISHLYQENKGLKFTLVYCPEGYATDEKEGSSQHLIDTFTKEIRELGRDIVVSQLTGETSNRKLLLKDFSEGKINVLTSMKCLDEGVDIPRAETAIFCASTGNPRQYIQRRGRILRKAEGKFSALIYDLVVQPTSFLDPEDALVEKRLMENELRRVYEFATLAENRAGILRKLQPLLLNYGLDVDGKIK